jgi:hypothetical protein
MTNSYTMTENLLYLREGLDDEPNVEVTASVADSSVPYDPDLVDTVPNIPPITDDMEDPRGWQNDPSPAA